MAWRTPRGFWEYLLLQVPDLVLAGMVLGLLRWWGKLSTAWAVGLFCLWLAKDLAMFACMRDVFAPPQGGLESLVGTRGVAKERLAPVGHVLLEGELWRAETVRPGQVVAPGAPVVVRARRGLTLLVEVEASSACEEGGGRQDEG
ncbi:MAG TPA: NfeD family protein [Candidatus Methylomirabilis sp.]|nr:NfeD family protein [Candidatus Methylomirabilis sp.]